LQKRIQRYNVEKWATDFMDALNSTHQIKEERRTRFLGKENLEKIIEKFKKSTNKIFFLDYDGTLTGFNSNPEKALPDQEIYAIINQLLIKNVKIVIISGRGRIFLEEHFRNLPVDLVAEHGVLIRRKTHTWRISHKMDTN